MTVAFLTGATVTDVAVVDSLEVAAQVWPGVTVVPITAPAGIGWSYDAETETFAPPVYPDEGEE